MANETTSTSLSKLYTNKTKVKGTYRVYKPKPLKQPKKKWFYLTRSSLEADSLRLNS